MESGFQQLRTRFNDDLNGHGAAEPSEHPVSALGSGLHGKTRNLLKLCSSVTAALSLGLPPKGSRVATPPRNNSQGEQMRIRFPAPQLRRSSRKRSQSPDARVAERCRKRRRVAVNDVNNLPAAGETWTRNEVEKFRDLSEKTEKATVCALARIRALANNLDRLDAPSMHALPSRIVARPYGCRDGSTLGKTNAHLETPLTVRTGEPEADLKTIVAALKQIESTIAQGTAPSDGMDAKLHCYYRALLGFFPGEDATCCTCPPVLHRRDADSDRAPLATPRPRIGVDAQGHAFDDWSACSPEAQRTVNGHPLRCTSAEKKLRLDLRFHPSRPAKAFSGGFHATPAPLLQPPTRTRYPDRTRYAHLNDLSRDSLAELNRWNRCKYCVAEAMRTLPPWTAHASVSKDPSENGDLVFVRSNNTALLEWDGEERRWRHMVLHHHRWISFEDWENAASGPTHVFRASDLPRTPLNLRRGGTTFFS
ncbi:hypothetical protein PUNSTDRAFT_138580 [Punctularia strigosozonata HHB-11173 SS5]|uniref:Uncharacterized protein n=1 Tax=Punctularia strigosozonata (strain HHB-11173) TaxID=741275 RepID=R7S2U5_PUNST|nr:uncharacterized protein PUNSTDRAFT_138580 [Punctularia strigosozonata HHB-11173 SS5]EIN04538.1 hypothetical protein PUNSTDRAFT_138580 [Punctularia strigosozonata HHB-11173 SS5]